MNPTIRIEHLALYVNDLEAARAFFIKYFHAVSGEKYHNKNTDFSSYFLSFSDGSRLELMTKPGLHDVQKDPDRTGYIHLAFSLGSRAAVDTLTETMKQDGCQVLRGPRITGDGYYESCLVGFEGNLIELTE